MVTLPRLGVAVSADDGLIACLELLGERWKSPAALFVIGLSLIWPVDCSTESRTLSAEFLAHRDRAANPIFLPVRFSIPCLFRDGIGYCIGFCSARGAARGPGRQRSAILMMANLGFA